MAVFRWVCTMVVWVIALIQLVPVLVFGRKPWGHSERPASPGLWAVGVLLIPIGCTLGIASYAWRDSGLAPIGPAVVALGLALNAWSFRKPRPQV